jgi:hypothetical protein
MARPKTYAQYKYEDVSALGLDIQSVSFLKNTPTLEISKYLETILDVNLQQSLVTEKAKSEFIIAPILFEIARINREQISFFSGHNLDVEKSLGLKGFCDFLYARVPKSPIIKEPIFCIVEAKNDNLEKGIPQCIAEMYASTILNERQNKSVKTIYGCVTTGYLWQFLKLEEKLVSLDTTIYSLKEISEILGVLQFMVESK